jgi:hypothetical protein
MGDTFARAAVKTPLRALAGDSTADLGCSIREPLPKEPIRNGSFPQTSVDKLGLWRGGYGQPKSAG